MDYARANRLRVMIETDNEAIAVAATEVRAMEEELKSFCTHPDNMIVHTEDYYPGSYFDTAYTTHRYHCGICGTKFKDTRESHSWYG